MVHEYSDANFQTEVIGSDKLTFVDFWAEWSGPCKMMSPIIEELSNEFDGRANFGKLDVDNNPETPINFNVRGIPTFLVFKNGELKYKISGAQTKQYLKDQIETLLN